MSTTTTNTAGTTVTIRTVSDGTYIYLSHPEEDDGREHEAGRIVRDAAFQPAPFSAIAMSPTTLRTLADAIEQETTQ